MPDRVPKQNPIERVKCVVDTCVYYESGNMCKAEIIEIQPPGAVDSETTDCATFAPREDV